MEETKEKWTKLQKTCRDNKIEVMYTVIESLTRDGRDRSRDYVITGFHVAPGSFDAQVCIKFTIKYFYLSFVCNLIKTDVRMYKTRRR